MKKFRIFMPLLSTIYVTWGIWAYIEFTNSKCVDKCRLGEYAITIDYLFFLVIGLLIWGLVETIYYLKKKRK